MVCKNKPSTDETLTGKTCATPWHITCLHVRPVTLADTLLWDCPDCSIIDHSVVNPVTTIAGGSGSSSGLLASIRAIEFGRSLTNHEKVVRRQNLMSGNVVGSANDTSSILDESLNCSNCYQGKESLQLPMKYDGTVKTWDKPRTDTCVAIVGRSSIAVLCLDYDAFPENLTAGVGSKFPANTRKEQEHLWKHIELEKRKMQNLLNEYLLICEQVGVQAEKLHIETSCIEKGIVQVISHGAAAKTRYSRTMTDPKSKKVNYVNTKAPVTCHIWFVCKGHLAYTRYLMSLI